MIKYEFGSVLKSKHVRGNSPKLGYSDVCVERGTENIGFSLDCDIEKAKKEARVLL